jgi:hypothetical protein
MMAAAEIFDFLLRKFDFDAAFLHSPFTRTFRRSYSSLALLLNNNSTSKLPVSRLLIDSLAQATIQNRLVGLLLTLHPSPFFI